jgi:hypothetical protein
MPIRKRWKLGDHLVVDDRTGFTRYASQTRKEWNGFRVAKNIWWPRHPQDMVRGLTDKQAVDDPRPQGVPEYTGPLSTELTADHAAGDQTITILSSTRFAINDRLLIGLDNRQMFSVLVQTIPDATSLTLATKLPWAASSGNAVMNTTAVSASDIS